MRLFTPGNKKRFWPALLSFFIIVAVLTPAVHSHDIGHDDGSITHALTLKAATTHNHAAHHEGEWHGDDLFAPAAGFTDFSLHDHDSGRHFHVAEERLIGAKQGAATTERQQSAPPQAVGAIHAFKKVPTASSTQCKFTPLTPPSLIEFVFAATDLPPPAV